LEGDCFAAVDALKNAFSRNDFVPELLLNPVPVPERMHHEADLGTKDEALLYAFNALPGWTNTPGALDWLRHHSQSLNQVGGFDSFKNPFPSALNMLNR
jgi:hypothetical protein